VVRVSRSFRYTLLFDVVLRDRRKLTFYFVAEKRIDFRELVRELFRYVELYHLSVFTLADNRLIQAVQNENLDGLPPRRGRIRAISKTSEGHTESTKIDAKPIFKTK